MRFFANCQGCGKPADQVDLSARGLCNACSTQRVRDSVEQMQQRSGPYYARWLNRRQAAMRRPRRN